MHRFDNTVGEDNRKQIKKEEELREQHLTKIENKYKVEQEKIYERKKK